MLLLVQLYIFAFAALVTALPAAKRGGGGSIYGITYTGKSADGQCHSADQVSQMVKRFQKNGIQHIRTYSQECDILPNLLKAIQNTDMQVVAAAWIDGSGKDEKEISSLVNNLKNANSDQIAAVAVGNECVQGGLMSASDVASKIKEVKGKLGGKFKVGTVDTPTGYQGDMFDASDIVFVNIHPFFGAVSADDAVDNLNQQLGSFKGKAGGKDVVVGEVGWPSSGDTNGKAVPSTQNLTKVYNGLKSSNIKYYFFEAQDSNWKNGGEFNVEPHWGIMDANGKSKISEFQ